MARRPTTSWRVVLRDARSLSSGKDFQELVRYLARRAAEDDFESLLMQQRRKKMKELRNTNDKDSPRP